VKKVRAILQLIDDDQGARLDGDQRSLRSVNRTLSDLRDADVLMETLARLRSKHPHLMSERAFARPQPGRASPVVVSGFIRTSNQSYRR
jgi:hypothetical protein